MATKVPLFQRTELPPGRAGVVKPPLSLADRSGQIGLAQATAKFAGSLFDNLVQTTAANEEAVFEGTVATEMEKFNTFVKSKPGASFEELESERNKMITRIEAAGQLATTRQAKTNNAEWLTRNITLSDGSVTTNKGLIYAKTQSAMVAIRVNQQLATFNVQRENLITSFKRAELADLTQKQVESGLLNKDFAAAQLIDDLAVIDKAEKKVVMESMKVGVETQAFAIAADQGYPVAEEMLRDPKTMTQLLEAGLSREDARSLLNDVSERVKHDKVVSDDKLDAQREADRGNTYDVINAGEYKLPDGSTSTDIRKFIESTSLDEDEQEAMWQKSIKETDRKLKGVDILTNPRVRSQLYKAIPLMLSGAVSRDELLDRANNARFGEMVNGKLSNPTLNDSEYKSIVTAINAQYEQGYGQMMSRVNDYAEGILLKTDSLGFVENAPVRHKQMGDFQQAWFNFVASKGDALKISDIYPEGRRLAASFQISDTEAQRRETEFDKLQTEKESEGSISAKAGVPLGMVEATATARREDIKKEPKGKRKKLTTQIQVRYLKIANGDIEEAKRLAIEDGYKE